MGISAVHERRVRDAYGASLALVVVSIVVSITFGDGVLGVLVAGLLQASALVAVLQVTQAPPRILRTARALGLLATVFAAGLTLLPEPLYGALAPLLWGLVVLGVAVAILRHLRTYATVTVQAVLGLVTVYLLVGLLFAYTFMFVDRVGGRFFVDGPHDLASFVYFSFVTLATVGYGDLHASPGLPRALAVLDGVLGQLYLVTVVALAVGRIGQRRHEQ